MPQPGRGQARTVNIAGQARKAAIFLDSDYATD